MIFNKIKVFYLLIITLFIITSCSVFDKSKSKKPEVVAQLFLNCMNKHDYEKAKKYCTANTQKMIEMMDQLIAISGKEFPIVEGEAKITKTVVEGEKAICYYNSMNKEMQVNLVKEYGKWLVDMKKEIPAKK